MADVCLFRGMRRLMLGNAPNVYLLRKRKARCEQSLTPTDMLYPQEPFTLHRRRLVEVSYILYHSRYIFLYFYTYFNKII
ncbi:hypothetical protein GDO78_021288 [Eleutherodactylus coqui]|uniref:Uncharacterized protein n=1 Tax=Eleutherodactylus coqui TaxID=57060 RepID=A0A8J6C1Z4_ELECQ|nr:hypothetical protein GDO78_021288 [Eleutherodactylus coqui]